MLKGTTRKEDKGSVCVCVCECTVLRVEGKLLTRPGVKAVKATLCKDKESHEMMIVKKDIW